MRFFSLLTLALILASCARGKLVHRPGEPFTQDDVLLDRNAPKMTLERVDHSPTSKTPRSEELVIPVPKDQNKSGTRKSEEAPKIEFLLNQMQVSDATVAVGLHAGLVQFSAKALIDSKAYDVKLEGYLKDDSTADLVAVDGSDDNFRSEVFCQGEVHEGYYSCDSLFVDLYYKVNETKFYREQLEVKTPTPETSPSPTASPSEEPPKATATPVKDEIPTSDDESEEDTPDPAGPYVGRPERVNDLFSENKDTLPKPSDDQAQPEKPKEQPPTKKVSPAPEQVKPELPKPEQPKPQQKPIPPQKTEAPKSVTPGPAPAPAAPEPKKQTALPPATPSQQQKPQPQQPKPQASDNDDEPIHPAKVILEVGDEPNRPTDQSIGGYGGGGRLENATEIPFQGEGYYFSQPQEHHNYGAYDLVRVLKILASKVFHDIFPNIRLRITDIGNKKGGPCKPHKGHQNGLEADIGYLTNVSDKQVPQPVVTTRGHWLNKMMMKQSWETFKFLGASDRVSLLYVNVGVKPHICSYVRSQGELKNDKNAILTLRKIQEITGHETHFHLRMECGRYNPRCRTDGPPAASTGC